MRNFFSQGKTVRISPSIVVFSVLFVVGLYFLYFIRDILTMIFGSLILMAALDPAVRKLESKAKIPRFAGILIVYALLISFLAAALMFIVPALVVQLQNLSTFVGGLEPLQNGLREFKFSLSEVDGLLSSFGGSVSALFDLVSTTFSGIFTIVTVLVMASYLLLDRNHLHKKIGWFTDDRKHFKQAKDFIDSVELQLGGWVRGQLILMGVIGVVTYIGLLLIGIPYAVPLAIVAGLLEILPNLGPTIAAIPAIILAFAFLGWPMAVATAVFYIVVQQLENNIIVPRIMKANADVNPLTTIVTILVGLKVGGVIGALLAVPAYIVLRTVYSTWLRD